MNLDSVKSLSLNGKRIIELAHDGEVLWRGLPSGYVEVDYLEFTGEQYISTGFAPNQDTRIVCEFRRTGGSGVYGARSSVSSRNFSMRAISGNWQIGYGDGVQGGTIAADENWHIADHNKNELYIDGVLAAARDYQEFSTPYVIAIGAIRASTIAYGMGCYRKCKIYNNGVLVRDMIPCLNADGEAGMYDLVTKAFMGNAGSGTIGYKELS